MGLEELNEDIHRRDYEASGGMKNDYDPRAASSVPSVEPSSTTMISYSQFNVATTFCTATTTAPIAALS